jgi:hypothetical protein
LSKNPKFETLNPKQFQSTKFKSWAEQASGLQPPNSRQEPGAKDRHPGLRLEHYDFEFV